MNFDFFANAGDLVSFSYYNKSECRGQELCAFSLLGTINYWIWHELK